MSTLPRQIAWDHCPVYDPTPGRRFEGCKCGAQVTGQAHQEHVVEVTEAAVRAEIVEAINAEEIRLRPARPGPDGTYAHPHKAGLLRARSIVQRREITSAITDALGGEQA